MGGGRRGRRGRASGTALGPPRWVRTYTEIAPLLPPQSQKELREGSPSSSQVCLWRGAMGCGEQPTEERRLLPAKAPGRGFLGGARPLFLP